MKQEKYTPAYRPIWTRLSEDNHPPKFATQYYYVCDKDGHVWISEWFCDSFGYINGDEDFISEDVVAWANIPIPESPKEILCDL